jgi:polyphosphate kinase
LHHPYDSFDVVIDFLGQAARDPNVTEIFHTLYRTNNLSPITKILKTAAKNGKKVIVYVEINARFDEMNNVMHANELRKAGVKVITPIGGYKVHSKITKICRTENNENVCYLHMGTGNYHAGTARQYTDLGLLTANKQLAEEATMYCDMLQAKKSHPRFNYLLVSPVNLHNKIISLIHDEIRNKNSGAESRIIAKMNALTDINVIEALYEASRAGVRVDLIIRGTCCLRPGIPGLSENIRVISIVDRFLEHSRIYYFEARGQHKIYLSSADWRPRNFLRRYEIAFPVIDTRIKQYIRDTILLNSLRDNVKARVLQTDGSYRLVSRLKNAPPLRSQFIFEQMAEQTYKNTPLKNRHNFIEQ